MSDAIDEPLFDPSLKKKKAGKKSVGFSELDKELEQAANEPKPEPAPEAAVPPPTAPAAAAAAAAAAATAPASASQDASASPAPRDDGETAPAAAGDEDLFGGLKKKSKKKKPIPTDFELEEPKPAAEGAPAAAAEDGAAPEEDLDFGDLKKKSKKKKKGGFDLEAFEKELRDGDEGGAGEGEGAGDEDLGDDPFGGEDAEEEGDIKEHVATWLGTDRDYTYQELLGRFFSVLRAQNPALAGEKKKYTIVPPVVQRDGSKKTSFANLVDICKRMHRQPDHVIQYLFAELGTEGNLDGSQRLIIKGRFQPKQIENVLRRYILEYVTCKTCKSPKTLLTKENRIFFMRCEACGSTRSVATIKTGFQAQTGRRSKMRQ